jgi:hypothetical protein
MYSATDVNLSIWCVTSKDIHVERGINVIIAVRGL